MNTAKPLTLLQRIVRSIFGSKSTDILGEPRPFVDRIPDTSGRGTRRDRGLLVTPRVKTPKRLFFAFTGPKVKAPNGYAFNGRGDLVSLKRHAQRQGASRAS